MTVWVDFNGVDEHGHASTLLRDGARAAVGDQVVARDDDGNTCRARVLDVQPGGLVELALDMATFTAATWDCEAYGPDIPAEVGALCFFADAGTRDCRTKGECSARMAEERKRAFRRIHELAAAGNETGIYLAGEFTHPEQLLGGGDEQSPDGKHRS